MKTLKYYKFTSQLVLLLVMTGCGDSYLDVKPVDNQKTPQTVADYQAIMDDASGIMNVSSAHALGFLGADEYVISDAIYNAFTSNLANNYQRNAYTWNPQVYQGGESSVIDWTIGYTRILRSNLVISGLESVKNSSEAESERNNALGCAFFHRGLNYFNLAQLYSPLYQTGASSPGLPLRLDPDVTIKTGRATVENTYQQILLDLKRSASFLPIKPVTIYRPGKTAAYALLAKTYLLMGDYASAILYADSCLLLKADLIDYNVLDLTKSFTFSGNGMDNKEVIFMSTLFNLTLLNTSRFNASPISLDEYEAGDLRKAAFYVKNAQGRTTFKGSYNGNAQFFTGIATDEIYLIKAESAARLQKKDEGLAALNALLKNRINKTTYQPKAASSADEVLRMVITERRKELVLRGTRWQDLRRLNLEPAYGTTLRRKVGDREFELKPGDQKYLWPIPPEAIELGGYQQNPR